MSGVSIAGDTSGSILLAAPAVAGSSTVTLPTTGGTVRTTTTPGTVLQVVSFYSNTYFGVSTNTPTATGYYANITPASTSNKILISFYCSEFRVPGNVGCNIRLYKNGSVLTSFGREFGYSAGGGGTQWNATLGLTPFGYYMDSPSTTSSIRYEIYAGILTNSGTAEFLPNGSATVADRNVTLTLTEIAG